MAIAWVTQLPWLYANFLILGIPLVFLLARSPEVRSRLRFSFILRYIAFVTVVFDYLCVRYGGWGGPSSLPHLPGKVTVEQLTWTALFIPLVLATNETFFAVERGAPPKRYPRTILISMFFTGFAIALVPMLRPLAAGYVYLKVGLALYPAVFVLALWVRRSTWREMMTIGFVFGAFNLAFELLALHLGYWTFRGRYVGMVSIVGYRFPTEELIFLVALCAPSVVAAYSLYKNWKAMQPITASRDNLSTTAAAGAQMVGPHVG